MKADLWSAAPLLGDVAGNVQAVTDALETDADLVVFPELYLTGYNIGDDVQRLAFSPDDPRLEPLREACRANGTHLIVGAPYTPRAGLVYNGALCIDDEGRSLWIPKRALPNFTTFREALFFDHGESQPVWETKHGNIGVHICYDLYFPEMQKKQVLEGADILINISASPSASRRFFEALLPARAIENACFTLYSNNVGSQDGIVFWGGAQAFNPRGERIGLAKEYEQSCIRVELDLDDLVPAREFRPTLRDSDPAQLEL